MIWPKRALYEINHNISVELMPVKFNEIDEQLLLHLSSNESRRCRGYL